MQSSKLPPNLFFVPLVFLLCALLLANYAIGGSCRCDSSCRATVPLELAEVADSGETVLLAETPEHSGHSEDQSANCRDETCFCCLAKLPGPSFFRWEPVPVDFVYGEFHPAVLPHLALPPPFPPPKSIS